MTQQRMVWQARDAVTFMVADEWPELVEVTARPIVTSYWFGTTVGLFYREANSFGYWYSSNTCGPITAWRVAQILPRVKTMRNRSSGYDQTLCGLVIAMNGDRHEDRMRERAKDLGMTVGELDAELKRLNTLWPSAVVLHSMWKRLPESAQDQIAKPVRQAITDGLVEHNTGLESCVEQAEIRLRSAAEQAQHEDELIINGLDDKPWESLKMLAFDLGVTNLVYTRGCGDLDEPSHYRMADLDREIMSELIGTWGGGKVTLLTTTKDPDDPSAHLSGGGGGIAVFGSNFGKEVVPMVMFGDEMRELAYARFDRVTERFQLAVRPAGGEHDDEILMTIPELRAKIGETCGLGEPLEPGHQAPWVTREMPTTPWVDDKGPSWVADLWDRFMKRLGG